MRRVAFTWDRLTASCVLSFCLLVSAISVGMVLGELRDQLDLSGVLAAAHGSTFGVGLLVAGTVGLRFVDAWGRQRSFVVACGSMLAGVTMLCVGFAWPVTLLGAALSGMGGALLVLLMPGIVADHHGPDRAAAFAAINGIPGLVGITLSLVVGGVIAAGGSWRWPYFIIASVISAALIWTARGARVPDSPHRSVPVLPLLRRPDVRAPWLRSVNAVMVEFPVGVWAVSYLKEVGHASGGLAVALGAVWGLFLFLSRMALPTLLRRAGDASLTISYAVAGLGALLLWAGPGLAVRVVALSIIGIGAGPLYPLAVEGIYRRGEGGPGMPKIDSLSLGAIAALASGTAITIGPMALGVLSDLVGLRHALLVVPVLATVGIATSRPRATSLSPIDTGQIAVVAGQ